ncbi:MAG: NUDIX hydrolase N-terminal domain-containing protein [Candidatus Sericytochromatia bacterium]
MPQPSWSQLREELRSMAQQGLHYRTGDAYDLERYTRLLELAATSYAEEAALPVPEVLGRFRQELGHVTPKVGADAAIFNAAEEILLIRRSDDGCWGLPCGWCDVNESPRQALERELREELALTVRAGALIEVFTRLPGDYGSPHTSYHLLFAAELSDPTQLPIPNPAEVLEWGWFAIDAELDWHRDHADFARCGLAHFRALKEVSHG